ncbi:hypothetical protein [Erythrobacter sanguineus]|uniref:hypothetical protein n=1 Tax=Erythrobacter sanguineus TaxID=198312 RepID=UPI000934E603|nr:hypothetical protein [Erythrobacter sanguineus]
MTRGTARGFYFDSDFDVTTVSFDFPPPVTVNHTNEAWALFGQVSCALTESPRVTGGLRVGYIAGKPSRKSPPLPAISPMKTMCWAWPISTTTPPSSTNRA